MLQKGFSNRYMYFTHSRALATQRATEWSTGTIGTEPHACIEIENDASSFVMVNMAGSMESGVKAPCHATRQAPYSSLH